jgi:hypothetical protein
MLARVNLNDTNLHEALSADKYNQTKYRYYFAKPPPKKAGLQRTENQWIQ